MENAGKMGQVSQRQRALSVLQGEMPASLPLITRLETWYKSHCRTHTLPGRFQDSSLDEVHRELGVGRLRFTVPYALELAGVEVLATFNGEPLCRQSNPVIENFPGMWDYVPTDRAGITTTQIITPAGRLTLTHQLHEQGVLTGTDPYLKEHLIKADDDYRVVEYILERARIVPLFGKVRTEWEQTGENGLVVPLLHRIPFQQVLLEYLGETGLFYALFDAPDRVHRLLELLDRQMIEILDHLADLDVPYVEFPDNLHGSITHPKLFRKYCLPAYQKYCDTLHRQGKKAGSHTDGDVRPLLAGLKESGLDVCESFSPYPLTPCTFEEAWQAWRDGPLIWGGIPSPILEESTSQADFTGYIDRILALIDRPVILGVVDLMMPHNSIERLEAITRKVETFRIPAAVNVGGAES